MKKKVLGVALGIGLMLSVPHAAFADAAEGDVIITVGKNLSESQKNSLLKEMNQKPDDMVITVSNAEEHKYLDKYVPKAQIGTRAISSTKITVAKKGSGVQVKTNNITWVNDEMYKNALITAGVKDADVYVTAPFPVSGTAGLTGVMLAYEKAGNATISEEKKQVANQEMVETAKLGDQIGTEKANDLITEIKKEVAKEQPKTEPEMKEVVQNTANNMNINIGDVTVNNITNLFMSMEKANVDWGAVSDQLGKATDKAKETLSGAKDKVTEAVSSEEAKGFFKSVGDAFNSFVSWVKSWF